MMLADRTCEMSHVPRIQSQSRRCFGGPGHVLFQSVFCGEHQTLNGEFLKKQLMLFGGAWEASKRLQTYSRIPNLSDDMSRMLRLFLFRGQRGTISDCVSSKTANFKLLKKIIFCEASNHYTIYHIPDSQPVGTFSTHRYPAKPPAGHSLRAPSLKGGQATRTHRRTRMNCMNISSVDSSIYI